MIFGPNGQKKFWQAAKISGWVEVIGMCQFNKSKRTVLQHLQALWRGKAHLGRTVVGCGGLIEKRRSFRRARLACCIVTAFVVIGVPVCGLAQVEPEQARKVLVLNSYHRGYDWSDRIMDTIQAEFGKTDLKVDLYWEYMDAVRRSLDDAYAYMKKSLEAKYRDFGFDLIISSDDPALHFLLGNRDFLFPGVPIVFCGVQQFEDSKPETYPAVTGVLEVYDWESTVKIALKFHPSATQIVVIHERDIASTVFREEVASVIPKLERPLDLVSFSVAKLTMAELLQKVRQLGDESIVLYDSAQRDSNGQRYTLQYSLRTIREHCAVPIYVTGFRRLGLGPVGGKLTSGDYQGLVAAKMAIRILEGETAESIPIQTESPNAYMFDYHQLQRFGIALSALPKESIIINQPQSFYYRYRRQIWAVAAIITGLGVTIMILLGSIIYRRRAEKKLQSAEAKYRSLVEQIPAVTYVAALDRASTTIYVSPQIETIIGLSPEQYKTDPDIWRKQLHPDDRQRVLDEVRRTHETEEPLCCEYRMLALDGRVVWLRDEAVLVRDSNRRPLFLQGIMFDITDRTAKESELRESEERFRAIFDNATDGILVADPKTRKFFTGNKKACQMLGYEPEGVKDLGVTDIHPPEHVSEVLEQFEKQVGGEITLAKDIPIKRRDGSVFYADVNSAPVKFAGKTYLMGIFRDVTDRKAAEDALRESQELFNAFMDQLPATAFIKDEKSRVRYANAYVVEHFGGDKWVDRTAAEYFPPEIAQQVLEHDRKVLSEGASDREEWLPDKGGETCCMHTYKFPIRRKGKPVLLGGISVDVTEHRRAQDALRESRRQQSAILDTIPDIAWLKDEQSRYIAANEPFGESCGVEPESLVGKTDFDLWPEDLAKKYRDDDKEVMRLRRRKRMVEPLEDSKGKRSWLETIKTPIYNEHDQVVGTSGIGRDITEVKQAQEQLEKAHRELELRVQERTVELENANIDLRNEVSERKKAQEKLIVYQRELRSLASELSLAEERLKRRIATDIHDHVGQKLAISKIKLESLAESVSSAEVAGSLDEIRGLIAEIIKSTRSLTFELSPPVLYELGLEAAVEWLVRQAREQHGLTAEFRDDRRPKPVDNDVRVLLFQAVRELLVNVAKHAHANKVKVSTRRVGDEIRVSVADDGVGFDTSRASSQGYTSGGFGLFSIHERLGHIGGYLKVESTPGRGTRISLVAPINHKTRGSKGESR